MVKIQKSKKHCLCNNCGKQQSEDDSIFEIKISPTGQGWTVIMLCGKCMSFVGNEMKLLAI